MRNAGIAAARQLPITNRAHKAGIVRDLAVGALLTARNMAAERRGTAALDRRHHLELAEADMAGMGPAPCRAVAAENVRDLQRWTRHERPRVPAHLAVQPYRASGLDRMSLSM
jgi:hypothetical protein